VVSVGHDATLEEGHHAESVVAVFGNATSAGEVSDSVVAVLGDSHVTGPVADSVVAVMGNVYVNSRIEQNVVAVMGDVELGPQAVVNGELVVIGGSLIKDPQAQVEGGVNRIATGLAGRFGWAHTWVQRCLAYGRPLAVAPGLEWVWGIALGFLLLYVLLGLLFPGGIERCVQTFEQHPGESVLTALAALLLVPLLTGILLITVVGMAAVPFLLLSLAGAILFGKAAIFAWLGRRLTAFLGDPRSPAHTMLAILVGGVIVLALYCVPVAGLIIFNLLGLLALGVALYALLSGTRSRRVPPPFGAVPPPYGPPPFGPPPGPAGGATAGMGAAAMGAGAAAAGAAAATAGPAPGAAAGPGVGGAGYASTPAAALLTLPRAAFWPRMAALLIDVVLIAVLLRMTLRYDSSHNTLWVALAAYGAIMWKLKGMTIGGIIFGQRVVRLDGQEIDWPTAIVRGLGCMLSAVCVGLGFIWIAVDENRQAWHDKIAGTVVVCLPPGTARL
jgi:uncharacterized RDD family membrane protein YckC